MKDTINPVVYIHYGSTSFDREKFQPASNDNWVNPTKPEGGLWACRADAEYNWHNFCEWNWPEMLTDKCFRFKVRGNIFRVHNCTELQLLPGRWIEPDGTGPISGRERQDRYSLNFEKIRHLGFDAVELCYFEDYPDEQAGCMNKYVEENHDLQYALSCWDLDSIVVLNADAVVPV